MDRASKAVAAETVGPESERRGFESGNGVVIHIEQQSGLASATLGIADTEAPRLVVAGARFVAEALDRKRDGFRGSIDRKIYAEFADTVAGRGSEGQCGIVDIVGKSDVDLAEAGVEFDPALFDNPLRSRYRQLGIGRPRRSDEQSAATRGRQRELNGRSPQNSLYGACRVGRPVNYRRKRQRVGIGGREGDINTAR